MKADFHVVIAGAGVVGLTLAALLARSQQKEHIRLTVVDAAPRLDFTFDQDIGLRVSAISTGSADILQQANAWADVIGGRVCAYSEMRAWDSGSAVEGPETLCFSASRYAVRQLGFIVENQLIQHALLQSLESLNQQVEFSTSIRSVNSEADRFSVTLSDGRSIEADLVVGADGGASFVRKQSGITVKGWQYEQSAFVTHLHSERHHQNTAWQRFLRSGPVALLPLADDRVSMVWSTTHEEAAEAMELSDDELSERLTAITDNVLGKLTLAGPRGAFPLRAQHASKYVLPGLALIGDAAHSVHPLAGQGANLGIADAACLAGVLTDAIANDEVIGDFRVLRRYERARKGANSTMLHFISGINRLFAYDSSPLAAVRATGMRIFNKSGPIRDHAVRVALGLNDA
jgi:2-octaprenylphenol hydroxylase